MCNLETEGTKYGCGHYQITKKLRKIDCGSQFCTHSALHPAHCQNCACEVYLGPDKSEKITAVSKDYCSICRNWYGNDRRR